MIEVESLEAHSAQPCHLVDPRSLLDEYGVQIGDVRSRRQGASGRNAMKREHANHRAISPRDTDLEIGPNLHQGARILRLQQRTLEWIDSASMLAPPRQVRMREAIVSSNGKLQASTSQNAQCPAKLLSTALAVKRGGQDCAAGSLGSNVMPCAHAT